MSIQLLTGSLATRKLEMHIRKILAQPKSFKNLRPMDLKFCYTLEILMPLFHMLKLSDTLRILDGLKRNIKNLL